MVSLKALSALSGALMILCGADAANAGFTDRHEFELRFKKRKFSELARENVARNHFVFVAGIYSELLPGYFTENGRILKEEMGAVDVSYVEPPTAADASENADRLPVQLLELYSKSVGKPLVVIAHSKGAFELFLAAARSPDVFALAVRRVVLISAPFGGSPIADRVIEFCQRHGGIRRNHLYCNPGMESLTTEKSEALISDALSSLSESTRDLIQRTFTQIKTHQQRSRDVTLILRPLHRWQSRRGLNDGLVLLRNQELPGFDFSLGTVDADHSDLVCSWWVSHSPRRVRSAFMRALIQEILEIDG